MPHVSILRRGHRAKLDRFLQTQHVRQTTASTVTFQKKGAALMSRLFAFASVLFLGSVLGCNSQSDDLVTIKSPSPEIYYTVETSRGHGPVSNDFTRVFAHFSHDGKSVKQVVISGEYIEHAHITWTSPNDVDICVKEGITDTFRNEVTLITGDTPSSSVTIHNHLKEQC
ncbi:MAG: hypothetical protein ABI142_08125 [Bryocella sp.]